MRAVALLMVLACALAQPMRVEAQDGTAQDKTDAVVGSWTGIKALPPADKLVVKRKDGEEIKGKFVQATDAALSLRRGKRTVDVPRAEVFQIYRVVPKSRKKAAAIGAAVGGGFGIVTGSLSDGAGDLGPAGAALAGAVLWGGLGALIGAGVARGRERVLIYEASR